MQLDLRHGLLVGVCLYTLRVLANGGIYIGHHWVTLPNQYDRWTWRHPFYVLIVLSLLGFPTSGWIVGRLHRRHQVAMVLAYLMAVLLVFWVGFARALFVTPWIHWSIFKFTYWLITVTMPVTILFGGLWSARADSDGLSESQFSR